MRLRTITISYVSPQFFSVRRIFIEKLQLRCVELYRLESDFAGFVLSDVIFKLFIQIPLQLLFFCVQASLRKLMEKYQLPDKR